MVKQCDQGKAAGYKGHTYFFFCEGFLVYLVCSWLDDSCVSLKKKNLHLRFYFISLFHPPHPETELKGLTGHMMSRHIVSIFLSH